MMRTTTTRAQESHPSHREITVGGSQLEFLLKKKQSFIQTCGYNILSLFLSPAGRTVFTHSQQLRWKKKKKQERELASLFPFTIALLTFGGYTP